MLFAYFCAFFKCVIYGSTVFFTAKLSENVDVIDILALRFLLSFSVMSLLRLVRVIRVDVGFRTLRRDNPRRPYLRGLILAGMFEPVLYMLFETVGISMTSGITTAVILSLSPVFSLIVERVMLHERATAWQMVFLGCGIFGAVYITLHAGSSSGGQDSILGIVFVFLAVISGALFCGFSRQSGSHFSAMEITYVSCFLGTVVFNAINLCRHLVRGDVLHYFAPYWNVDNLIGFVFLGVLSTVVATAMNNYAHSRLQVSTVAAFGGVSTLVTIAIGLIFGNEQLYFYHYVGLPFILLRMIGVSAISILRDKRERKELAKKEEK
jgi:drug/metabolite transporter (DMT)-like permease